VIDVPYFDLNNPVASQIAITHVPKEAAKKW
jgi:hypothetical protein